MRKATGAGMPAVKLCLLAAAVGATVSFAGAAALEDDLGRNETRVRSASYPLTPGRTVEQIALLERHIAEQLGGHPDRAIFTSLPRSGSVRAAR